MLVGNTQQVVGNVQIGAMLVGNKQDDDECSDRNL